MTIGNRALQRLVRSKNNERRARGFEYPNINILQPKLKISQPGDAYEQEADKVADQLIRMPDPSDSLMPIEAAKHEGIVCKCTSCKMKDEKDEDLNISRKSPSDLQKIVMYYF